MKVLAVLVFATFACCIINACQTTKEIEKDKDKDRKPRAKKSAGLKALCIANTGVSNGLIEKAHDGIIANDEFLKCYIACLLEEFDLFRRDSGINMEKVRRNMPKAIVRLHGKTMQACADIIKGRDKCDTAYKFALCFLERNPAGFFLL